MYILLQPELHLFACWYGARVEISAMRDIPMLLLLAWMRYGDHIERIAENNTTHGFNIKRLT